MLPSQRALFNIPRDVYYLNAASWSPLPIATQEAGRVGVARKGRPWLIDPALPGKQYERARRAAARLINAEAEDVALISSVSYGVAAAAKLVAVPAGARVLVLENDHSSAVLEWTTRAPAGRFKQGVEENGKRSRRPFELPPPRSVTSQGRVRAAQVAYWANATVPARARSSVFTLTSATEPRSTSRWARFKAGRIPSGRSTYSP
jgi:hypothetical protein